MLIARFVLAAIFAVAAVAKLADREGSRRAVGAFGFPERLVAPVALALPLVELAVAVLLIPASTARLAAGGACLLLIIFSAAVARAIHRGEKPDCNCLGRVHSAPAGPWTLARNAALASAALLIAWQPARDPSALELVAAGVAGLVLAQTALSFTLFRRYGRALERIDALEGSARVQSPSLAGRAEAPRVAVATAARPAPRVVRAECEQKAEPDRAVQARDSVSGRSRGAIGRAAVAGTLAGTAAVATVARAAPPTDPELKAIDDMLRAAEPSLAAAAKRSRKAVGEQATLKRGKRVRRKRRAARDALGAQRGELLGLRAKVDALPASTADAHNVKNAVNTSLTLFAESLEKQQRAIGARPETARKLLKEAEEVFLRSLASSAVAGKLLGREQS